MRPDASKGASSEQTAVASASQGARDQEAKAYMQACLKIIALKLAANNKSTDAYRVNDYTLATNYESGDHFFVGELASEGRAGSEFACVSAGGEQIFTSKLNADKELRKEIEDAIILMPTIASGTGLEIPRKK